MIYRLLYVLFLPFLTFSASLEEHTEPSLVQATKEACDLIVGPYSELFERDTESFFKKVADLWKQESVPIDQLIPVLKSKVQHYSQEKGLDHWLLNDQSDYIQKIQKKYGYNVAMEVLYGISSYVSIHAWNKKHPDKSVAYDVMGQVCQTIAHHHNPEDFFKAFEQLDVVNIGFTIWITQQCDNLMQEKNSRMRFLGDGGFMHMAQWLGVVVHDDVPLPLPLCEGFVHQQQVHNGQFKGPFRIAHHDQLHVFIFEQMTEQLEKKGVDIKDALKRACQDITDSPSLDEKLAKVFMYYELLHEGKVFDNFSEVLRAWEKEDHRPYLSYLHQQHFFDKDGQRDDKAMQKYFQGRIKHILNKQSDL